MDVMEQYDYIDAIYLQSYLKDFLRTEDEYPSHGVTCVEHTFALICIGQESKLYFNKTNGYVRGR